MFIWLGLVFVVVVYVSGVVVAAKMLDDYCDSYIDALLVFFSWMTVSEIQREKRYEKAIDTAVEIAVKQIRKELDRKDWR